MDIINFLFQTVRSSMAFLFGSTGEILTEKSGHLNLGIPGTMCVGAENMGSKQYSFKSDPRITKVGRVLRATSIDELPQLFNIIKSEMSLIGFRPPLTYHPFKFEEYTDEQKVMFELKPGITGWAQVHGRKDVEWGKRIELNVWYAKHCSFLLDLKIFFVTIIKVLSDADNENKSITAGEKELINK